MYMHTLCTHHPNSSNCILEKATFTLCIQDFKKKKKHQSIDSKSEKDARLCENLKPLFIKKAIYRVGRQPSEWKVITYKSGIGWGASTQNISTTQPNNHRDDHRDDPITGKLPHWPFLWRRAPESLRVGLGFIVCPHFLFTLYFLAAKAVWPASLPL